MKTALVIDSQPLGRNTMRVALERLGYAVTTHATVGGALAQTMVRGFQVVSVELDRQTASALDLLAFLGRTPWEGVALYTTTEAPPHTPDTLHHAYPVLTHPQSVPDVLDHLRRILPESEAIYGIGAHDIPEDWTEPLQRMRRDYGERIQPSVSRLMEQVSLAEVSEGREGLVEAIDLAHELKGTSGNFHFVAVSEVAGEIEHQLRAAQAEPPANWSLMTQLLELLHFAGTHV